MTELLDEAAIDEAVRALDGWERDGEAIVRTFKRRDWDDAIALVTAVAPEAEARNHHPDVSITSYRLVSFRLTTHSAGGITQRDLDLARRIDELAGG
jgi:4a-hydroxytetrahydrobiopterin dehydratase